MAAAIGAGLPVAEADRLDGRRYRRRHHRSRRHLARRHGHAGSVRVGGDKLDEAIINYISRNYGMLIGENTAENIKKTIGSAFPGTEVREMEVSGINKAEGIPRKFTISSNEILEALTEPLNNIVSAVKSALEKTPPNSAPTSPKKGMVLTGGGACLRDLDRLLMEETGLPVVVAEDPLTCVARGSGLALEKMDKARQHLRLRVTPIRGSLRPLATTTILQAGTGAAGAVVALCGDLHLVMVLDAKFRYLEIGRQALAVVLQPLQQLAHSPARGSFDQPGEYFQTVGTLQDETSA